MVTGATRGIGKEITKLLTAEKCIVLGVGKDQGDLSTLEGVRSVIYRTNKILKHVDILINCAGIYLNKPIEECFVGEYNDVINLNFRASWLLAREYIPYMKKQKWGRIVTIASRLGREGGGRPWFNMAKSAEISLDLVGSPRTLKVLASLSMTCCGFILFFTSSTNFFLIIQLLFYNYV